MASLVCTLHVVFRNRYFQGATASRTVILPFVPLPGMPLTGYASNPTQVDDRIFEVTKTVWVGKEDGLDGSCEVYLRGMANASLADPAAFASTVLGPKWSVESDSIAG